MGGIVSSLRRWLRIGSLERSDASAAGGRRVENTDALGAAGSRDQDATPDPGGYPPGYVKSYDEGRPRT